MPNLAHLDFPVIIGLFIDISLKLLFKVDWFVIFFDQVCVFDKL